MSHRTKKAKTTRKEIADAINAAAAQGLKHTLKVCSCLFRYKLLRYCSDEFQLTDVLSQHDEISFALSLRADLHPDLQLPLAKINSPKIWGALTARKELLPAAREHLALDDKSDYIHPEYRAIIAATFATPATTPAATPTPPAIPPKTPANTPAPPPPPPEPVHAHQMELDAILAQIRPAADIYHGQLRLHCLRWGIWLCRHSRWTPFTAVNCANDIIAGRRSRALSALLTPRDYRTLRSLGHIAHGRTAAQAVNRLCAQCSLPPFHYPMPGYPLSASSPALEESPRISSPPPREQAA
jgi:hypothetical protein